MKFKSYITFVLVAAVATYCCLKPLHLEAQQTCTANEAQPAFFGGKVITGYQGWFSTPTDGQLNRWVHWARNSEPKQHNLTFEVYPDISMYENADLAQTGFAPFGDGRPAKLFGSVREDVIDQHFRLMKEQNIDGAALQRFMTGNPEVRNHRDSITVRALRAAHRHGRVAYLMYDMSADNVERFKNDWRHLVENLKILESPAYPRHHGKPIVCIYGFGFRHRADAVENSLEIIRWLKNDYNAYVIGGVPRGWRNAGADSRPNHREVYDAFDMISPWIVGAFGGEESEIFGIMDDYIAEFKADIEDCKARDVDYLPIVYPGFAWSNWKVGPNDIPNAQPRKAGEFFWRQLYNLYNLGMRNVYYAMFDEYDEGTNWIPNATDWSEIPTDQYFLTAAADGYWLSSDFQLRAAGQGARIMKGKAPMTPNVTVPHSEGPVFYRNSFEKRTTTYYERKGITGPEYEFRLDPCFLNPAVEGVPVGVSNAAVTPEKDEARARSGSYFAKITGTAAQGISSYYYKFGDAKIEVKEGVQLSFWKYAANEGGLNTKLSLKFCDNTYLHTTPTGVVGQWTEHKLLLGQGNLIGKNITGLLIGYESNAAGNFEAYFDDVLIAF